ncbi:unnamed protein product [marine sediment metagenome]|uniref:Uncharacterized protein n=1 Tax=marine sediment metagenome TaxID=412755 RepID=X0YEV2_9ZZZZ
MTDSTFRMRVNRIPGTLTLTFEIRGSDRMSMIALHWGCDCYINRYYSGWIDKKTSHITLELYQLFDAFDSHNLCECHAQMLVEQLILEATYDRNPDSLHQEAVAEDIPHK